MNLEKFKENFTGNKLPKNLISLNEFQNQSNKYFSESFELRFDDKSGIESWSDNKNFLEKLIPFAKANASGSMYAIWKNNEELDLDELPIVVFGDEGGYNVVAENSLGLFQLLTFDKEIYVDFDTIGFFKDEDDYEESPRLKEYVTWLKENFNLDAVTETEAESIIEKAQEKFKHEFDNWVDQYLE